jgi:hypothetical protein
MWDLNLDFSTLLIGEGRYDNPDGSYYKDVDAGYLRNILFFGIPWVVLSFMYQLLFLMEPFNKLKDKHPKVFIVMVLVYVLVLHIKGEVLGRELFILLILFMHYTCLLYNEKWGKKDKLAIE